jgi:CBS domain-containing protein
MKVQEIMTREVVAIGPEADLRDVAKVLVDHGISGLPVCGAQRELLGVISEAGHLVKEGGPRDDVGIIGRVRGTDAKRAQKARALKAKDAMTAPVVTISQYASVAEAARRMSDHGIKRFPS